MPAREHIYSVLIVSASEKFNGSLCGLLPESDYHPVCIAGSVNEAQRNLQERSFDLVMINAPLPDDFGRKFAIDVSLNQSSVALLFVRSDLYDETYAKVQNHGVLTLRRPTSSAQVLQALDWMRSIRERLRRIEKKTISLEEKMAEIRM